MLTQFYIVEIKQYQNGEYEHNVFFAWDENAGLARLKGESKFHEILAEAAISEMKTHSAIMFGTDGTPVMYHCYRHETEEPEVVPDEGGTGEIE